MKEDNHRLSDAKKEIRINLKKGMNTQRKIIHILLLNLKLK
jgi:hypothetical protein